MGYTQYMKRLTAEKLGMLHLDVRRLTMTDLPDHTNVGDCAIVLGQFEFWRSSGIEVEGAYSKGTVTQSSLDRASAVAVQGGGNLGGLYPAHDLHRAMLAASVPAGVPIIQEPQSVQFLGESQASLFARGFGSRPGVRIAVRDEHSRAALASVGVETLLCPDAVHVLGDISAPAPSRSVLRLLRQDKESAGDSMSRATGVDWPSRTVRDRVGSRLRTRGVAGLGPHAFDLSTQGWMEVVGRRFRRGVTLLAQGETIVTDRLHAMLIGLQLGRRVVAVDNNVQKLQRYYDTWLRDAGADLVIVASLAEADALVATA